MNRRADIAEVNMLLQSNLIENEPSLEALFGAMLAWDYLMKAEELTDEVVRETHALLMAPTSLTNPMQPKYQGFYRRQPVYIGPKAKMNYEAIPGQMAEWLVKMNEVGPYENVDDAVPQRVLNDYTKDCHVEYEEIHPFIDGNGRTGRMFYNWHRLKLGLPVHIIESDQASRMEYYGWFK